MPENHIHLTVQTLSGTFSDDFNSHQKLRHVQDETFRELRITPAPGDVWELSYNDSLLDLDQSIEAAGVPNAAVLVLVVHEGGGGA